MVLFVRVIYMFVFIAAWAGKIPALALIDNPVISIN